MKVAGSKEQLLFISLPISVADLLDVTLFLPSLYHDLEQKASRAAEGIKNLLTTETKVIIIPSSPLSPPEEVTTSEESRFIFFFSCAFIFTFPSSFFHSEDWPLNEFFNLLKD